MTALLEVRDVSKYFGNVVALKTLQPLMTKPVSAYTVTEQQMITDYREFVQLRRDHLAAPLKATTDQQAKNDEDDGQFDKGEGTLGFDHR